MTFFGNPLKADGERTDFPSSSIQCSKEAAVTTNSVLGDEQYPPALRIHSLRLSLKPSSDDINFDPQCSRRGDRGFDVTILPTHGSRD
ncbi:hypothetical protein NPIL_218981 [Nephila pilipes]|uniref:Uncharacterized protein n=1 Tax=Nephila pilipes TaxID=299642 RepID=A0A8X6Q1D8_NEPPI|nr:hypothetical protein NPIL_218981 [Nephila pilipes]